MTLHIAHRSAAALLLTLILWTALAAQSPAPSSEHGLAQRILTSWTTSSGLPQNTVNALLQSRDGYLWVATQEGLARFDGVRFTVYDRHTVRGFPGNHITTLLESRDGSIWAGTQSGLVRFYRNVWSPPVPGLKGRIVRALLENEDGSLWVGTAEGLYLLRGDSLADGAGDRPTSRWSVRSLFRSADRSLWIGTEGDGLIRSRDDGMRAFGRVDGLPAGTVNVMFEDPHRTMWLGLNGNGLWRWDGQRFTRANIPGATPLMSVFHSFADTGGAAWISTSEGIVRGRHAGGKFTFELQRPYGAPALTTVYCALVDREGTLWAGTFGRGLWQLVTGSFVTHGADNGLADRFIFCVFEDRDRNIWVGSDGGGVTVLERSRTSRTYRQRDGLPSDAVFTVTQDRSGTIWVGTAGGGLVSINKGVQRVFNTDNGLPSNFVRAVVEDRNGWLWIGMQEGLCRMRDGLIENFTSAQGLTSTYIRVLYLDRSGRLWVGTFGGGVLRFENGVFRALTTADGLASNDVRSIYEDEDGAFWFGTDGGGLSRWKDGRVTTLTTEQGLPDDVVLCLVDDKRGNLWMSSNRGVARISRSALMAVADGRSDQLVPSVFGRGDGMRSEECSAGNPAGILDSDGRLWFPTNQGVVTARPDRLQFNLKPPPVNIEAIFADDMPVPLDLADVPAGRQRLEVQYTGLSFLDPDRMAFRYRLEGLEERWVDAGQRRSAFYTNVPPGAYVFHVQARNADGRWSDSSASVPLVVEARFYETRVFIGFAFFILLGLSAAAVVLRVKGLERRQSELERLVRERTSDLEHQMAIARTANAFKTHMLELASHDLKGPLLSIRGFTQILRDESPVGGTLRESLDAIQRQAQGMLTLINELLDASALEQGQLHLHRQRTDLSSLVATVVSVHRPTAERKRQTIEFTSDDAALCSVEVDVGRMQTAVENLVTNAIKYSPLGSTIRVSVTRRVSEVHAIVRDEGPGIEPDDMLRVFGRFQRLSAKPTGGESSTGLGLSIVKQLVELHGGRVDIDSVPGQGSAFGIILPASEAGR